MAFISDRLIRAMGFSDLPDPQTLSARFFGYSVYEMQGLALAPETCKTSKGTAAAVPYQVAVCRNLNVACRAIANNDFADDEAKWKEENKAAGPFALVEIGPTGEFAAVVSRILREPNGSLIILLPCDRGRDTRYIRQD